MSKLAADFGIEAITHVSYGTILGGMALAIRDGDASMIQAAEKLFKQSVAVLGDPSHAPAFNAFIACYAGIPDIESCLDLTRAMMENKDWPNPTTQTFATCLKGLTQHIKQPLSYEQGWKYIDEILEMMKNCGVEKNATVYGILFNLCGGKFCGRSNLNIYEFYELMKEEGIPLQLPSANSFLLAGVDHFECELVNNPENKEEIKQELLQYIDWALLQYKEYNLTLSKSNEAGLQQKISNFM